LDSNEESLFFFSNSFEALIEREWIQAGHPFRTRCTRSAFGRSTHGQESPLFTLFLDCTWQVRDIYDNCFGFSLYILQLLQQFACSFEFNDTLLIELFQHAYSSKFGRIKFF
jgi:myotubularin-related protein 9